MSRNRLVWDGRHITEARFEQMCRDMLEEIATILATAFISEEGYVCMPDGEPEREKLLMERECAAGIFPCPRRLMTGECGC